MKQLPILELQDPDGAYALIQVVDEDSARVLSSNLLPRNRVLQMPEALLPLSWEEASRDQGGWSRVGPSDFLAGLSDLPELPAPAASEDPAKASPRAGSLAAPLQLKRGQVPTVHPCPGCGREEEGQGGPPRDLEQALHRALRSRKLPVLRRQLRRLVRLWMRRRQEDEAA